MKSSSSLSEPFIRRPAMTTLLTVSVILFGVIAYRQLPVNDLPAVDYPVIQVNVSYPGASPTTVAANIATPLEKQFMQINGLELVTSKSTQGNCAITLQFDLNKSIDAAATDVQAAITQATGKLPVDLPSPPTFTKTNPNDQPILYIALTSNSVTAGQCYDYANTQVGQRISILAGVSQVAVYGTQSAVRIKANPSALAVRGMTVDDLAAKVRAGTAYQGAGQIDGTDRSFLLQPRGQLENAEQYNNLIVGLFNGSPVYLRDVATASDSVQDERISMRFWARGVNVPSATVVLAVFRQAGANAVDVAKRVRDLLPLVRSQLPAAIDITPIYDRSATIVTSVTDVQMTLIIAFVLVVLVIFLFLGRATDTMIPAVALPLSLLMTFLTMWVLGYSLDNLSLMALTLAIGFLVDDAIVFLENTVRRMEGGESPFEAAVHGAAEISFTILAMTISLAVVFLPLVFMGGLIGRIFREFAVTIIVSIFASGLVSLTLTPLMCARMLKAHGHGAKQTWVERVIGAVIARTLRLYGSSLWFFLRHRWISAIVWAACMVGTVVLFKLVPKSFLPIGDSSFIWGVMIAQEGTSPDQMHHFQDKTDKILHDDPNVNMTFTMTGNGQFLASNMGLLLEFLPPPDKRPPIGIVNQQLTGKLMQVPGALAFIHPNPVLQISTGATANNQGQFAYAISGTDPAETYAAAGQLMDRFKKFDGFATVSSDLFNHTPSLDIEILRDQAATYGVSVTSIENMLGKAYSQNYVYLIKRPTDQYQVIMEVADFDRSKPEDLGLLYVKSDDGKRMVPLNAVTRWHQSLGPQSVNHLNQFTAVTIFFNLKPDVPLGKATDFVTNAAAEVLSQSPGIRGSLQGEALEFQKTASSLVILMILAVFVMYVVLGILYESFIHPITVLSSLPVALVGGLLTLYLFGAEASLYAYIGMFMLMGIVKKNGIMMIDFALQRMNDGMDSVAAIHEASVERFRPIMMTTLAALMGAVPIAAGYGADGASRRPLGLVIVGGLIVSQFITLYVTPAIYLYLEQFQEQVLDRIPLFRAHPHGVPERTTPVPVPSGNGAHAVQPAS